MKIKTLIEYEYDNTLSNPFVAKTTIDGIRHLALSKESFEKAELNLMTKLENTIFRKPPGEIPPAKEIEIGE